LPHENKVCTKSEDEFEEHFRFIMPGYNVRPIEMMGAIGLKQLDKLDAMINIRRKNAEIFQDLFQNHKHFDIQTEIGKSSWFGFALIIKQDSPLARSEIIAKLQANNVDTRPIVAGNIAKKEMITRYFDYSIFGKNQNAEIIDSKGFYVGNHPKNITEEINYLHNILNFA
ncbi:DegT/DnrJ/EryC1/StrS family aminotransferase, partial [Rickettsiales bacterium]|nr:DegT/DnrJ/EryC1/StrS family aminotransferase [Rickettsiales bacterium]